MRLIFIKYLIVSIFIIINIEIYSNIENNDSETLKKNGTKLGKSGYGRYLTELAENDMQKFTLKS